MADSDDGAPLPENWIRKQSSSKNRSYYFNVKTKESRWTLPTEEDKSARKRGDRENEDEDQGMKKSRPEQVKVRHILVKHKDSRRPSSWKEEQITRTKEEALEILQKLRKQVEDGKDFGEIAETESDCSSAKRGGDLGFFARGSMQKPFEDVSFSLRIGQLSQIVSTDSGVHIIERTG